MKNTVAPTFRACPEQSEGSARAELKLSATTHILTQGKTRSSLGLIT
jgi:hypothetical protein